MGRCLRLIRLSRGNGTENKAGQQRKQTTGAIHRAKPSQVVKADASTIAMELPAVSQYRPVKPEPD
jgi:hypothetical protein